MAGTTVSHKCPACGAPLAFKPGGQDITCEFCGTKFSIEELNRAFAQQEMAAASQAVAEEAKWQQAADSGEYSAEEIAQLRTFTCSSCGAEVVCDENTMATECCYCGNPTMLPGRFAGSLRPNYVIPFKVTKAEAVQKLNEFYKGKPLLPDAFTANNRVEDIQGMYVPFWLFDTTVVAQAVYDATTEDVVRNGNEIITTTHHYRAERSGTMAFEHIPVDGSRRMRDDYMDSIEPFNFSAMQPFNSSYLAGYLADKYDVTVEEAMPRLDTRLANSAARVLGGTLREYKNHSVESCSAVKSGGLISYAMVPVWILTTKFNDEPYTFMVNGQTGKLVGSLPIDEAKASRLFWRQFLTIFGVIAAIVCGIAWTYTW